MKKLMPLMLAAAMTVVIAACDNGANEKIDRYETVCQQLLAAVDQGDFTAADSLGLECAKLENEISELSLSSSQKDRLDKIQDEYKDKANETIQQLYEASFEWKR